MAQAIDIGITGLLHRPPSHSLPGGRSLGVRSPFAFYS